MLEIALGRLDAACSRFRPDSELSRANACAGRTVEISPLLAELVAVGLRAYDTSQGRVDPTLGSELRAAGYDRTFTLVRERDTWAFTTRARRDSPSARRAARHRAAHIAGAGRGRARSRGDGQGLVRRPDGRADRSPDERRRARLTGWRHRGCRNAAGDGLADPHRSGPRHAPRRAWPDRRHHRGRPRDIEHDRSALAHRPRRGAPHPRPGDRRACADTVAMRQRGGDQLCRRKRRCHGGDRPRRGGTGLARGARASPPASSASAAATVRTAGWPDDRRDAA